MTRKPLAVLTVLFLGSIVQPACAPPARLTAAAPGARASSPEVVQVAPPTGERETDRSSILAALERVQPGGTVQFASGTYLVGELIRVEVPRITLVGHPDGTTLRGCDPAEYVERAFALNHCHGLELTGGHQTVRNLTFEYTWHGLILGCCFRNWTGARTGSYLVEGNTFRNSTNGIRVVGQWLEPAVIRDNRFINLYHAVTIHGSVAHILDNDISVPEPERVPISGHPGSALAIVPHAPRPGPLDESMALVCAGNVIAGNRVEGHVDGITIGIDQPGAACRENVIRDNAILVRRVFSREHDAFWIGVPLALHNGAEDSILEDNLIEANHISGAEGLGIEVHRASRNRIVNNTVTTITVRDSLPDFAPGSPQDWSKANGSGIWISPGSEENEIVGNVFEDIASDAIVLEGNRNRVETLSTSDAVRDLGSGNRVTSLARERRGAAAAPPADRDQVQGPRPRAGRM